jgi:hypothetical protein
MQEQRPSYRQVTERGNIKAVSEFDQDTLPHFEWEIRRFELLTRYMKDVPIS